MSGTDDETDDRSEDGTRSTDIENASDATSTDDASDVSTDATARDRGEPRSGDTAGTESGSSRGEAGEERGRETGTTGRTTAEYATEEDVAALREDVAQFADDLEERTVERDDLESDLRRYVRRKVRSNHARGWGPYLVLLYGTAMTVAAFYSPHLGGGWAILAMLVIWLSVLGLYTLFVLVGIVFNVLSVPGRLRDRLGEWRS